ncbi:16S rRNA (cytidine(1402)-2'-O)-methyltransferase [Phaeovulum sp.]|uniref:16S rRNA (cytidine(1402)-2'-O)-methyltransferase n=1 Tax=Phaeovulum sp. TaxID=2934796 RepID=UPI0039E43DDF
MTDERRPGGTLPGTLAPGLHFIATPIGAARDITLRALDILATADVLAAEDTRTLRHLMEIHGVPLNGRRVVAYHDHNGEAQRPYLMRQLAEGKSLAYASEAGTPLVADPGYQLGRAAIEAGVAVYAAPGPSAVLAALTVSGLPSDRFLFAGFPPNTKSARRKWLTELAKIPATLIFYESPKRVGEMLGDLVSELGGERQAAVCRELTKRFEEIRRGTLADLAAGYEGQPVKGEIVVVVDRAHSRRASPEDVAAALKERLGRMSVKDAASEVAEALGLPRREVYQAALAMEKDG